MEERGEDRKESGKDVNAVVPRDDAGAVTTVQTVTSTVFGMRSGEDRKKHNPFADILQRSERRKS